MKVISPHFVLCLAATVSAVLREILLPILKEIKNEINSVRNDLLSVI